jgi:hypothetical protein
MHHRRSSVSAIQSLILASAVLCPGAVFAQHHGGHGGMGGIPGATNRPTGVDEKDTLKDFHQALAVQATSQQVAEFQILVKSTEDGQAALQAFQQQLSSEGSPAESAGRETLDPALENARNGSRKFQEGFSTAQKSGLKETTKRLAKSDSDLEQEQKKFDEIAGVKAASAEVPARAESLAKALTSFYNQELALGREMSITLANGQDLAFTLPQVRNSIRVETQTITVDISGALEQVSTQSGQRTFKLGLLADLSDLQQNITVLLRSQLDSSDTCGQRIAIREATLTPTNPSSLMVVKLHFERWTCMRSFGQQTTSELAESDGSVELKLTPEFEKNVLRIGTAFARVDASGMLANALRSGSLGEDLREKAAQIVLSAALAGTDFKTALPSAIQNSTVIQSARFQDASVGGLALALSGQVEISDQQADQLATQLNQALSAKTATPPGTVPQLTKRPE